MVIVARLNAILLNLVLLKTVLPGVKRFEQSHGLDTVLYKNILFNVFDVLFSG